MNERIRLLAKQAGYQEDGFGFGHWDMPECKKFAELIVRECISICKDKERPNLYGVREVEVAIKQHFGVE